MVILRNKSRQSIQTVISLALLPVEERPPPHNFPQQMQLLADLISCTFVKARARNITGSFMKIGEVIGTAFEITSPPTTTTNLLPAPISPLISVGRGLGDVYIRLFLEFHSLLQEWAIREN